MNAAMDLGAAMRLAEILEGAATEIRKLVGTCEGSLPSLASPEQQSPSMVTRPETRALLTTKELAETLRVNTRTLRDMVRRGDVPRPCRMGKNLRWRRADIENWIQEQPAS